MTIAMSSYPEGSCSLALARAKVRIAIFWNASRTVVEDWLEIDAAKALIQNEQLPLVNSRGIGVLLDGSRFSRLILVQVRA